MNARTGWRLVTALCTGAWVLALLTGNTAGGLAHLLAAGAALAFFAQARVHVIPTPFEAWQAREALRVGGRR